MTASNYRPLGRLLGNSPDAGIRSDAPNNLGSFGYPTTQPNGAVALAAGEGATAQAWNRFVAAVGMNADRLFAGGHARPIAVPALLTSSDAADLGSVAAAAVDLTPSGSFDGWVYHGTSGGNLSKYFRLLDSDGTPCRTAGGALIEVTDVQYLDTSAAVGVEKTLHTVALTSPATTAHARHKIVLATAPSTSSMVGATTPMFGCIVRVLSNSVNDATKGTNNGRYRIADGLGGGTEFKLVEYRHRIRLRSIVGTISAAETVTGATSGASFVVGAGVDDIYSDYVEFDTITLGSGSRVFEVGETVSNGLGATGIVIAYTAPGDPVILNNDVNAVGTAVIKSDGSFSRLVQLILSGTPANASSKLLACGGKGAALEVSQGALAMAYATSRSGSTSSLDGLDGIYQRSSAPSASGLAGNPSAAIVAVTITAGGPFTVSEVLYETSTGRRFATVLQVDSSTRLVVAAHNDLPSSFPTGITGATSGTTANLTSVTLVRGRDVVVDAGAPVTLTGSQLLDLRADKSAARILMTSNSLRNTGISIQGGSSTPASGNAAAIEVREPLTSVPDGVDAEEPVSYAWDGTRYTLTFSGTDLTNFLSTVWTTCGAAHVAVEVSGATHPALNGVYLVAADTATTIRLLTINNSGYATEGTATAGGHATARFFARRVSAFGLNQDGSSILNLLMTAGSYKGLTLHRYGSTANSTLMQVRDNSASVDLLAVKADVAAGTSDDPDYTEAPVVHTNKIRSSSDKRTAGADGTRYIDLSGTELFAFSMSPAGGAGADVDVVTFEDGVFTFRPNALAGTVSEISLLGTADGAVLVLDEQHTLWSSPNGGAPLLYLLTDVGGVGRPMTTLEYIQNSANRLYISSPTFAGTEQPLANGDLSQLMLGQAGEVILEAQGTATSGEPDAILRTGAAGVLLTGYADGGTQAANNSSGNKPMLVVPDIRYGAHSDYYPEHNGKINTYNVPLSGGFQGSSAQTSADYLIDFNAVGAPWWMYVNDDIEVGAWLLNPPGSPGSYVLQIPPMSEGASGEAGMKWFRSLSVRFYRGDASDKTYVDLYYGEYIGGSYEYRRIARDYLRISVPGEVPSTRGAGLFTQTVTPSHFNKAVSGAASSIELNPVEDVTKGYSACSSYDGLYAGWTVLITAGTGAGQSRVIDTYNGSTSVATTTTPWTDGGGVAPDNTSVYVVYTSEVASSAGRTFFVRFQNTGNVGQTRIHSISASVRTTSLVSAG